jgi:hypothetical protein
MKNICNLDLSSLQKINNNSNQYKALEIILSVFKITDIGVIKIDSKDYVIKREFFTVYFPFLDKIYKFLKFEVNENIFYNKFEKKIKKYNFNRNIQLPIKYKICKKFNIYLFKKIQYNLNNTFLRKINKDLFNNILIQSTFIIYFINHKLNVFHNDISQINKLRNFMINKNDKKLYLKLDNQKVQIKDYNVILIDFGLFNKNFGFKNNLFYYKKNIEHLYLFEIKSELLIVVYLFLISYYNKKEINFKNLYFYFYDNIKVKSLKEFDKFIFESISNIDEILIKINN